jgi:hypothetical protein
MGLTTEVRFTEGKECCSLLWYPEGLWELPSLPETLSSGFKLLATHFQSSVEVKIRGTLGPTSTSPTSLRCRETSKEFCSFRLVAAVVLMAMTVKSRRLGSACSGSQKAKDDKQFWLLIQAENILKIYYTNRPRVSTAAVEEIKQQWTRETHGINIT